MKKTLLLTLAAFALVTSLTSTIRANEDPDNNKYHITSIRWINANQDDIDQDDRYVVLVGKVVSKVGDESYLFNDGTGTIQLDSEDIDLPVGGHIVVRGRVDQDFFGDELEVNVRSYRKD